MNFWVNLTGHAATWRFQHSDQIDEWLASVPWRRDGDVRVLRIPCPELFVEIATALGRAARAVDIYGDIDVLILPGVNDERSIEMRLRSEFGLSDEATFRDFLRHFVSKLTRPTVIIAFVARASDGVLADDEARGLRDRVAASHPTVAATFVLMDVADAPLTGDGMRVTIGGPNCIVLRSQLVGEEQAWRAYTHVRLAWEVGGNLGVALEWNESAFDSLQRADDDGFERILNDRAEVAFAALDSTVANSVNDSIAKASSDRKVHLPENLFWSPAEDDWPRVPFFVAITHIRRGRYFDLALSVLRSLVRSWIGAYLLKHAYDPIARLLLYLRNRTRLPTVIGFGFVQTSSKSFQSCIQLALQPNRSMQSNSPHLTNS